MLSHVRSFITTEQLNYCWNLAKWSTKWIELLFLTFRHLWLNVVPINKITHPKVDQIFTYLPQNCYLWRGVYFAASRACFSFTSWHLMWGFDKPRLAPDEPSQLVFFFWQCLRGNFYSSNSCLLHLMHLENTLQAAILPFSTQKFSRTFDNDVCSNTDAHGIKSSSSLWNCGVRQDILFF